MIAATSAVRIPVAQKPFQWLVHGVCFTAMSCAAYWGMFHDGFSNVPGFAWWFVAPILSLLVVGFGFFLSLGVGMLLYCVEHIEISKEEIRLKLGPFTVKKLPTTRILTVGYVEQGFGKHRPEMVPLLFLSTLPAEELIRIGEKEIRRDQRIEYEIRTFGSSLSYQQKCIYAACQRFLIPWFALGFRTGFVIGYSSERNEMIRPYISSAKYFVE